MLKGVSIGMVRVEEWGLLLRGSDFVFVPAAMGTVAEWQYRIQLRDGAALFPGGIAQVVAFDVYVNFSSTLSHRENK